MKIQESIYNLHGEHTEWINKLKFYTDDLVILTHRLEEIASKNTSKDILAEVERFQNQFIVQKQNIDELMHEIKADENSLEKEINENPVAVDHRKMNDHTSERDAMQSFEKNFNELRTDFNEFLAKWM